MKNGYRDIIKDDKDLALFLGQLSKFDKRFCEHMMDGVDYTLKIEVHGAAGKLVHCRVMSDHFARPPGAKLERGRKKNFSEIPQIPIRE